MTHLERLPNSRAIVQLKGTLGMTDAELTRMHFSDIFEKYLVLNGLSVSESRYVKDEWAQLKRSYKTIDYPHRVRESGYITYTCSCCGDDKATDGYTHGDVLRNEQLCFSCHCWGERMTEMMLKPKGKVIAGGTMFHLNNGKGEGHGGARFIFKLISPINGHDYVESSDVWGQGQVPERFRHFFPDTAIIINNSPKHEEMNFTYPTPLEVWGK